MVPSSPAPTLWISESGPSFAGLKGRKRRTFVRIPRMALTGAMDIWSMPRTMLDTMFLPASYMPAAKRLMKSQVAPKLMKVRRVLFFFERVYWRLNEIQSIAGADVQRRALPSGGRVSDLYAEIAADKAELEKKTAAYRFALRLYAERNEGREPFADDGDGGDFFDDTSSFFD